MSTGSESRIVTHGPTERPRVSAEPQEFDRAVQSMEARLRAVVSAPER